MAENEGRAAFITGGAGGLGAATALRLARDGFNIALADLNEAAASKVAMEIADAVPGRRVVGIGCDVSDTASVNDAVAKAQAELGFLGIAINNAGVTRDNLLFKMTDSDWDTVMNVHLRGAFLVSRAVQAGMVDQGWGRIVNLSSVNALGMKGQANYSTAKMGLQGFTRTLAMELGPKGVTVNAVAPGYIRTPMTEATADRLSMDHEEFFANLAKQAPLRRVGEPSDIANAIAFLVSDDASFVTGQTLYVDGGLRV